MLAVISDSTGLQVFFSTSQNLYCVFTRQWSQFDRPVISFSSFLKIKTAQKSSREVVQWLQPALWAFCDESLNRCVGIQIEQQIPRVQSQRGVDHSHSCGSAAQATETLLASCPWERWKDCSQHTCLVCVPLGELTTIFLLQKVEVFKNESSVV